MKPFIKESRIYPSLRELLSTPCFSSLAMRFPELEKESLGMARKRREGEVVCCLGQFHENNIRLTVNHSLSQTLSPPPPHSLKLRERWWRRFCGKESSP
jgi:hypothetical protein